MIANNIENIQEELRLLDVETRDCHYYKVLLLFLLAE
jgi:hypothetical protein